MLTRNKDGFPVHASLNHGTLFNLPSTKWLVLASAAAGRWSDDLYNGDGNKSQSPNPRYFSHNMTATTQSQTFRASRCPRTALMAIFGHFDTVSQCESNREFKGEKTSSNIQKGKTPTSLLKLTGQK